MPVPKLVDADDDQDDCEDEATGCRGCHADGDTGRKQRGPEDIAGAWHSGGRLPWLDPITDPGIGPVLLLGELSRAIKL